MGSTAFALRGKGSGGSELGWSGFSALALGLVDLPILAQLVDVNNILLSHQPPCLARGGLLLEKNQRSSFCSDEGKVDGTCRDDEIVGLENNACI